MNKHVGLPDEIMLIILGKCWTLDILICSWAGNSDLRRIATDKILWHKHGRLQAYSPYQEAWWAWDTSLATYARRGGLRSELINCKCPRTLWIKLLKKSVFFMEFYGENTIVWYGSLTWDALQTLNYKKITDRETMRG